MKPGYRALAANRDFQRLWIAQTVSEVGIGMSRFAFPIVTYAMSGSAMAAAAASGVQVVALVLVLLPAGALVDRWDRRRVLVLANAGGAVAAGSLVVAGLSVGLTVPHLLAAAAVLGVVEAFSGPAEDSAVRQLVARDLLPTAMSQQQARMRVAGLVSGPIGGALIGLARWVPFAANAVAYVVAWFLLLGVRGSLAPVSSADRRTQGSKVSALLADVCIGLAFVMRHRFARLFIPWAAASNLLVNALMFVVLLRMIDEGWSPAAIGAAEVPVGLAGIAGAFVAPRLIDRMRSGTLAIVTVWVWPIVCLPLVWFAHPLVTAACLAPAVFANPIGNAGLRAFRMHTTPDDLQARVSSAGQFVGMSAMWLAAPLGGLLMATLDPQLAVAILLGALAVVGIPVTVSRSVRGIGRPHDWPDAGEYQAAVPRARVDA